MTQFSEVNFDGIVGPTHNYAGLSYGNIASMTNKASISSPRDAAIQGLAKMKFLHDLGVKQAVLPPHERPHLPTLRRLGFTGSDADVLTKAQKTNNGVLLFAAGSASAMWAANAATVSPSADTADGRVHFTPANLITQFHRSIESETTSAVLNAIFADDRYFAHHPPVPASIPFADEGAANHMRLTPPDDLEAPGLEVFVYGYEGFQSADAARCKFPERQTVEASFAIARLHGVAKDRTLYIRQYAGAIDAGAFHNDVVAVCHRNVLFAHQLAYQWRAEWFMINSGYQRACDSELQLLMIEDAELPLADAVSSYLFNSQLVTIADGSIALIAPAEAQENPRSRAVIDRILAEDNPIRSIHYVDVRQSMRNGGGPACLRLRVTLNDQQIAATNQAVLFEDKLHRTLRDWILRHYRETLSTSDLADPKLLDESRTAIDELSRILRLGSMYSFQR